MFADSELLMKSVNFEFLRPKWPELAGLGVFAETYAHNDPMGAIAKLRSYCEQVVGWLHHQLRLPEMQRQYVWQATRVRDLIDSQR